VGSGSVKIVVFRIVKPYIRVLGNVMFLLNTVIHLQNYVVSTQENVIRIFILGSLR
jgi:hypothetical protein